MTGTPATEKHARQAGSTLLRLGIVLGVLAGVAALLWTMIRHSIADRGAATETGALWAAVILSALTVASAGTSARRVRDDLADYRRSREDHVLVGMAAAVKGSAITSRLARGVGRGSADLLDQVSAYLVPILGLAAVGWWYEVELPAPWVIWVIAVAVGLLAGWTVAARVAAYRYERLRLKDVEGAGALVAIVLGGLLGAAGMYAVGDTWGEVEWPTVTSAAVLGASLGGLTIGTGGARAAGRRRQAITGDIAAVLGLGTTTPLEDGTIRWTVSRRGIITLRPGSAAVAKLAGDLGGLEGRLCSMLPRYEVDLASSGPGSGVVLRPITAETAQRRHLAEATEGLAVEVRPIPDNPDQPGSKSGREEWVLSPAVSPAHAHRVETVARQRGLSLLAWEPLDRRAWVGRLTSTESDVRDRLATLLRCDPWEVGVEVHGAEDREVDRVVVTRAPWGAGEARRKLMAEAVLRMPDGNPGWRIDDLPGENRVEMRWAPRPRLPQIAPLSSLLPAHLDPEDWATLPLGVGADSEPVSLSLAAGPHALIAGPTGSGKTIALLALVTGALARGHQLVLIDPIKAGLDFLSIRPWATAWADDLPSARAAVERAYEEVGRRKLVLQEYGAVKWSELSGVVRERENIRPMTLLIDEFGSAAAERTIPKGLPKDDPLVVSAVAENTQRAILKELVGRIAREARFVGIHLQIALQRPDVSIMGSGELRSNLTSAVQLAPPGLGVSPDALRMIFTAEVVDAAQAQITLLDDGHSRGLAVVAAEGGTARGLRVGYQPAGEIPGLLDALGVPRVAEPWDLAAQVSVSRAPREGDVIEEINPNGSPVAPPPPVPADLSDLDFSALDEEEPAPEPAPAPTTRASGAADPWSDW